MIIASILTSVAVAGYTRYREATIDRTVHSDVRNASTFMREHYLENSGTFPEEFPEEFTNWTRDNQLRLSEDGSCVEGVNPGFDRIYWRYSLVDNKVSNTPCPPYQEGDYIADPSDPPVSEEEETHQTPDPDAEEGADIPDAPPAGGGGEEVVDPTHAATISVDPIMFTGYNNHSTNQLKLLGVDGDLYVDGDFECNSEVRIEGSVVITGNAYLTNTCYIGGDLWVGGDLRMNSTPKVAGAVQVMGDMQFQSTGFIGGGVWTIGTFTSTDGKTKEWLLNSARILVGIYEATDSIPQPQATPFPAMPAEEGQITVQWADFLKQQAALYDTPSWSPIAQGTGCTVSPGASWSLPGDIQITADTVLDARQCATTEIGNAGTLRLSADLTIYVNSFTAPNGIKAVSADGQPHQLNIISPSGATPSKQCSNTKHLNLGSNSTFDPLIQTTLYSESKITLNNNTSLTGGVISGCTVQSGLVAITAP